MKFSYMELKCSCSFIDLLFLTLGLGHILLQKQTSPSSFIIMAGTPLYRYPVIFFNNRLLVAHAVTVLLCLFAPLSSHESDTLKI